MSKAMQYSGYRRSHANPQIIHQLKVNLNDAKPPIWRRILVPENITLYQLPRNPANCHGLERQPSASLHIDNEIYGDPENDGLDDLGTKNESLYQLNQLGFAKKTKFRMPMILGWLGTYIQVEKILPADPSTDYPIC